MSWGEVGTLQRQKGVGKGKEIICQEWIALGKVTLLRRVEGGEWADHLTGADQLLESSRPGKRSPRLTGGERRGGVREALGGGGRAWDSPLSRLHSILAAMGNCELGQSGEGPMHKSGRPARSLKPHGENAVG